ncbi:hypothetical protein [Undibacterium sp. TJN19]|uniref:hypothetical protein n=1 Tax=Undibacterium sp. TJN19 TaxID=3413055 RepID=UPI003BF32CBF
MGESASAYCRIVALTKSNFSGDSQVKVKRDLELVLELLGKGLSVRLDGGVNVLKTARNRCKRAIEKYCLNKGKICTSGGMILKTVTKLPRSPRKMKTYLFI